MNVVTSKSRNPNIDLLRIISISIVLSSHFGLLKGGIDGTHGVVIFFFVSGYCIQQSAFKYNNFNEFIKSRILRLFPTLLVCSAFVGVFRIIFSGLPPYRYLGLKDFALNYLCLPFLDVPCVISNLIVGSSDYNLIDGSYWSMLVELRYYFLFGILWFIFNIRKNIILVLILISTLSLLTENYGHQAGRINDFFLYLVFFAFGMAFYKSSLETQRSYCEKFLAALMFSFLALIGVEHVSFRIDDSNFKSYILCYVIFIVVMKAYLPRSEFVTKYLTIGALLTYPIYLVHQEIGLVLIGMLQGSIGNTWAGLFAIFISIALGYLLDKLASKYAEPSFRTVLELLMNKRKLP